MTFAEEAEIRNEAQGIKRTLKDLFAGAVGGVAQVLLGMYRILYPFGLHRPRETRRKITILRFLHT
jgi:hypothetical protein